MKKTYSIENSKNSGSDTIISKKYTISKEPLKPGLYLVATPIGNLSDISTRAIKTLQNVDFIACEDTRHSGILLNNLGIFKPLVAYFDEAEQERAPKIIERIKQGQACALISDAGTPVICDPGFKLVELAQKEKIYITSIPGASSVITALTLAGIAPLPFTFLGFVPEKKVARLNFFQTFVNFPSTLVCFETAGRLIDSLTDIEQALGNREIAVVREITKLFEETKRGKVSEVKKFYTENPAKGEIVLVIERQAAEKINEKQLRAELEKMLTTHSLKDASGLLADIYKIDRKTIYQLGLNIKG